MPTEHINLLVVVPPAAAPDRLVAMSERVVHLADATMFPAMLAELRATHPRLVAVFGDRTPALGVASSLFSAEIPFALLSGRIKNVNLVDGLVEGSPDEINPLRRAEVKGV